MGIVSKVHVLVGDIGINFPTSSEVAGKHVKGNFISGGGINCAELFQSSQQRELKNKDIVELLNLA